MKLEEDLEGLLHISELSDNKVTNVEDIVTPGMKVEVRVIRVDTEERKIGLSFVHADFEENEQVLKAAAEARARELAEAQKAAAPAAEAAAAPKKERKPKAEAVAQAEGAAPSEGATGGPAA